MALRFALVANFPKTRTDDEKFLADTLLSLEQIVSNILDATPAPFIPPSSFLVVHTQLTDATMARLFNYTNTFAFLHDDDNDYWNINTDDNDTPGWTILADTTGIPRAWLGLLIKNIRNDLNVEQLRLMLTLPAPSVTAPQLAPRGGTPMPPPDDEPSVPQTENVFSNPFLGQGFNFPTPTAAPRLSECARPLSAYLTGPKTAATQRAVQVSYGEDNSFIVAAPQQSRANDSITISMFHCASQKMQATVYAGLDLQLFHNNILSNYMDKYTMPSILSYELAVRQLIHDQPPGTRFQSAYLELGQLHLESNANFLTKQKILALEASGTHHRAGQGYGQHTATTYRMPSSQPRQSAGSSAFPPCHNFATGECNNLRGGKCNRDHTCAACNKAYPTQRNCPAGHNGEEVCPGVTELVAQRLSKRPFASDTAGGGAKRNRAAN